MSVQKSHLVSNQPGVFTSDGPVTKSTLDLVQNDPTENKEQAYLAALALLAPGTFFTLPAVFAAYKKSDASPVSAKSAGKADAGLWDGVCHYAQSAYRSYKNSLSPEEKAALEEVENAVESIASTVSSVFTNMYSVAVAVYEQAVAASKNVAVNNQNAVTHSEQQHIESPVALTSNGFVGSIGGAVKLEVSSDIPLIAPLSLAAAAVYAPASELVHSHGPVEPVKVAAVPVESRIGSLLVAAQSNLADVSGGPAVNVASLAAASDQSPIVESKIISNLSQNQLSVNLVEGAGIVYPLAAINDLEIPVLKNQPLMQAPLESSVQLINSDAGDQSYVDFSTLNPGRGESEVKGHVAEAVSIRANQGLSQNKADVAEFGLFSVFRGILDSSAIAELASGVSIIGERSVPYYYTNPSRIFVGERGTLVGEDKSQKSVIGDLAKVLINVHRNPNHSSSGDSSQQGRDTLLEEMVAAKDSIKIHPRGARQESHFSSIDIGSADVYIG